MIPCKYSRMIEWRHMIVGWVDTVRHARVADMRCKSDGKKQSLVKGSKWAGENGLNPVKDMGCKSERKIQSLVKGSKRAGEDGLHPDACHCEPALPVDEQPSICFE
jgi:hypothetical protein